ncbi:MAG TPA: methyltransferase domain-containing protein [Actinomycetota bacterium]|nr:methyltransferase domain-containing protein [Actinomycetota bacterium]
MAQGADNADVVVGMYTPMAADYERIWAPLLRAYGLRLLDGLPLSGATRVLDLGCGVGVLLPDIAARAPGALVVGVDLTEGMLRRAGPGATVAVMDCTRLGFAEGSFDAIVSSFVVFHLPDPLGALKGVRAILRPGGAFALSVWGQRWDFPAGDAWGPILDAHGAGEDFAAEGPPDGEETVNAPEKLAGVLEGAGFTDVRAEASAWEQPWDLTAALDYGERMGSSRRRLATLEPAARRAVVEEVRAAVVAMPADALVQRYEVVIGSGTAPG